MIDEKKLIERLWGLYNSRYNSSLVFEYEDTVLANRIIGEVQRLIESQPKVGEWIPVSERLPEKDMVCLTIVYDRTTKRTLLKHRQFKNGRFTQSGTAKYFELLAWMPLPEPYKEGGD